MEAVQLPDMSSENIQTDDCGADLWRNLHGYPGLASSIRHRPALWCGEFIEVHVQGLLSSRPEVFQ